MKFFLLLLINISHTQILRAFEAQGSVNGKPQCEYSIQSEPKKIPLNRFFDFKLTVAKSCKGGQLEKFEFTMPEHNHGMIVNAQKPERINPEPTPAKANPASLWLIKELKAHMPGTWELKLYWSDSGQEVQTRHLVDVGF